MSMLVGHYCLCSNILLLFFFFLFLSFFELARTVFLKAI